MFRLDDPAVIVFGSILVDPVLIYQEGDAGNFIFIEPKTNAKEIVRKMKEEKKILIKTYENVGQFGDCLRVSIAGKKYMEIFMNALIDIDK